MGSKNTCPIEYVILCVFCWMKLQKALEKYSLPVHNEMNHEWCQDNHPSPSTIGYDWSTNRNVFIITTDHFFSFACSFKNRLFSSEIEISVIQKLLCKYHFIHSVSKLELTEIFYFSKTCYGMTHLRSQTTMFRRTECISYDRFRFPRQHSSSTDAKRIRSVF